MATAYKIAGINPGTPDNFPDRIMDAGFAGHFDFLSSVVNGGVLSAAAGRSFNNLVPEAAMATVGTAIPAGITDRGLDFSGGAAGRLRLPGADFIFGETEKHFAVGLVYAHGASPGVGTTASIAGYSYQTSTQMQWAIYLSTDSTGAVSFLRWGANGVSINTNLASVLAKLNAGTEVFIVGEFEVIGGTAFRRLYVDGVLVASASAAFAGSILQPTYASTVTLGPVVGPQYGWSTSLTGKLGRIWSKRWPVSDEDSTAAEIAAAAISAEAIAKLEYAAYGGAGAAAAVYGSALSSRLRGSYDAARFAVAA